MKNLGGLFLLMGIGSILLPMVGMQFILVSWIDNWGSTVGWVIRAALVVIGAGLFFTGSRADTSETTE